MKTPEEVVAELDRLSRVDLESCFREVQAHLTADSAEAGLFAVTAVASRLSGEYRAALEAVATSERQPMAVCLLVVLEEVVADFGRLAADMVTGEGIGADVQMAEFPRLATLAHLGPLLRVLKAVDDGSGGTDEGVSA